MTIISPFLAGDSRGYAPAVPAPAPKATVGATLSGAA